MKLGIIALDKYNSGGVHMYVSEKIDNMIMEFYRQIKSVLNDELCEMILFGSYARADFDDESDIDIAVLANVSHDDESRYNSEIVRIVENIYDIYGYSIVLSPIVISNDFYNTWKDHLPFYKNVETEGIRVVA